MALTFSSTSAMEVEANSRNSEVEQLLDQIRAASRQNQQDIEQHRASLEASWNTPATANLDGVSPAVFSASRGSIDIEMTDTSRLSPRAQSEIRDFYAEISGIPASDQVVSVNSPEPIQNAIDSIRASFAKSGVESVKEDVAQTWVARVAQEQGKSAGWSASV
jgi:hypothetical protein